jgi:hypothetical protein
MQYLVIDKRQLAEAEIRQHLQTDDTLRIVSISITSHDGELWLAAVLANEGNKVPRGGKELRP